MMAKKDITVLAADPDDEADFDVTTEGLDRGMKARIIRRARRATGTTQLAFSTRFRVPIGTLRDWEQARVTPPEYAVAYAQVIAADPEFVDQAIA